MEQKNINIFWIACFITVIGSLCRSVVYVMSCRAPLYIAFMAINIISLITLMVCLVIDIRKRKEISE